VSSLFLASHRWLANRWRESKEGTCHAETNAFSGCAGGKPSLPFRSRFCWPSDVGNFGCFGTRIIVDCWGSPGTCIYYLCKLCTKRSSISADHSHCFIIACFSDDWEEVGCRNPYDLRGFGWLEQLQEPEEEIPRLGRCNRQGHGGGSARMIWITSDVAKF